MEMLKVEHNGATFKVRPEDKDRFFAIHPAAKVAEDEKADGKAEEAPREAPQKADSAREDDDKAETEDKAVEAPNPTFRARRSER
jgi:hypothetical protein